MLQGLIIFSSCNVKDKKELLLVDEQKVCLFVCSLAFTKINEQLPYSRCVHGCQ